MQRKKQLVNGVSVKVENRSGFDKARFNALTTGVGTITPLVKQHVIPNSDGTCRVKISAQLPPLASDCYLRSHLKMECFYVPDRLTYGGFESYFCGREVYDPTNDTWTRAKLPRLGLVNFAEDQYQAISTFFGYDDNLDRLIDRFLTVQRGPGSLMDYLGISMPVADADPNAKSLPSGISTACPRSVLGENMQIYGTPAEETKAEPAFMNARLEFFNIMPFIGYNLIYDEYYRNKLVERPLFSPPAAKVNQYGETDATDLRLYNLPFMSISQTEMTYVDMLSKDYLDYENFTGIYVVGAGGYGSTDLLNGNLLDLRQRNYGDDYFTAATPNAQEGNPVTVAVVNNEFSIAALRMSNALQEFAEVNNYASPDYVQTLSARYGASLSAGIAQKPIFLGSADIPMFTSGVEQTAVGPEDTNNPFYSIGTRFGRAHAEGTEFVCKFHADEPGYFFCLVTLVPEAQYFQGNDKDMMQFIAPGSLTDYPCGLLEHVGNEPIHKAELNSGATTPDGVFGYVQRYLWHKLGHQNEVHGLFRKDQSLGSFVVQRELGSDPVISSDFLKVQRTDLDNVSAASGDISGFGVMIDSLIDLKVSEPLAESALPALSNPAREHGRSVYVKTGGSKLA